MTTENKTKKTATKKVAVEKKAYSDVHEALFVFQQKQVSVPRNTAGEIDGKKYMYADLEDINRVIVPELIACGLSLSTIMQNDNLITTLHHHDSKTHIQSTMHIGQPATPHEMGSRMTHYRRYAIAALLNLVLDKSVTEEPVAQQPQANQSQTSRMPHKQEVLGTPAQPQNSPVENKYYKNALNIIESSKHNPEALKLVKGQIVASPRLNNEETAELITIIDSHING